MPPDFVASLEPRSRGIDDYRGRMKASHYSLDVMAVEGIEVALNQFFLGSHNLTSLSVRVRGSWPAIIRQDSKPKAKGGAPM
ncbi:MAG TPA: hypothetical protein VGI29_11010 [Candidatus Binataceae bacterium]